MELPSFISSLANKENQEKELRVIKVRFIVTFLVWILCFVAYMQGKIPVMTPFNIYFILASIVNLAAKRQFTLWKNIPFTKYFIITFDIAFFTMVIYFTGGENSPFLFLYMLEIAGVAIFSNICSSILFTVVSIVFYVAMVIFTDLGILEGYPIIFIHHPMKLNEFSFGVVSALLFKVIILASTMSVMIFLAAYVFKHIKENEQKLEEKNRILSAINRITRRISAKLTLEELFTAVKFESSLLAPLDLFMIGVFTSPACNLVEIFQDDEHGEIIKTYEKFEKEKWEKTVGESAEFTVVAENSKEVEKLSLGGFITGKNLGSFIYTPLFTGDRNIGFFAIGSKKDNAFDKNFIEIIMKSTTPLAVAIEKSRLYDEIKELSIRDPLSNIYNRRYFIERLSEEISRSDRYSRTFSLLILDIDDFKDINDTYGHLTGDKVLQSLISVVKKAIRDVDILARYGGDEFVIIMPEVDPFNAFRIAERVRRSVENKRFDYLNGKSVTLSFGVASYPDHGDSEKTLIYSADLAMYKSKERGKNRVTIFTKG